MGFSTVVVAIVLIMSGVWGSLIIWGLLKRRDLKPGPQSDDPRIEELQEDHRQLEARLGQLEEEVSFFRELKAPEPPAQLRSPDASDS